MTEEIKNLRELYASELEPKLIELDAERRLIIKLIKGYLLISCINRHISLFYFFHLGFQKKYFPKYKKILTEPLPSVSFWI